MKRLWVIALAVLALTGCASTSSSTPNVGPSQIKLPIFKSGESPKYKRIVALADGSAEIVASLGYKDLLVGRDIASTMPELVNIPVDTNAHQVAVERVIAQKPDLIIIDKNTSPISAIDTLRKSGISIVSAPGSFTLADIPLKESAIAKALEVPNALALLNSDLAKRAFPKSNVKVAFLYLRGTAAIYLVGGKGSGTDSLLSAIGMRDVGAENLNTPFTALSAEALVKMNPDVILLMTKGLDSVGGIDGLVALPGIAQTTAGKERQIVTVDDSLLLSFGPRTSPMLPLLRDAILKVAKVVK
jgi:iron complex transport system substrate-binding protein